jgi:microcystin-dependent protein
MATPKIIADFTTQLATKMAVGATTATIVSNVDDDGVVLPTGTYYFTIDGDNSAKEHISCTNTAGSLTAIKSVSRQAVETSGVARVHRVGATVMMTDFATYKNYMDTVATGGAPDASTSTKGITKLSVAPVGDPIAVGNNDTRVPTADPTTLFAPLSQGGIATGMISPYAGRTAPSGYLLCDGSAVSRTTYAALLAVIAPSGIFTVTIASPAVFSKTGHGLIAGDKLHFTTTSGLPSGLATNTDYFVIATGLTADAFQVSATRAGTTIATTGSQSGVHNLYASNYGKGDGATTFNVPDLRGMSVYGQKTGDANFDSLNVPNTYVGEKTHVLTVAELAAHTHGLTAIRANPNAGGSVTPDGGGGSYAGAVATNATDSIGSDTAHNNLSPYIVLNYIVKT